VDQISRHTRTDYTLPCCLCGSHLMTSIEFAPNFPWVTSDLRPWKSKASLSMCSTCGLLQKCTDSRYGEDVADIYATYSLDSADGSHDHLVVRAGGFKARASALIERLSEYGVSLQASGSILDYGCGRGAFLRAVSESLPGWSMMGADLTEANRIDVEKIEGAEYTTLSQLPVERRYDVISLIHVVEHLQRPTEILNQLSLMLTEQGVLLIQVPDFSKNPFDLAVFDHVAHFSVQSLKNLANLAGLDSMVVAEGLIPREITMVAKPKLGRPLGMQATDGPEETLRTLEWLSNCQQQAVSLNSSGDPFGILGTQVGALWIDQASDAKATFFVDEAPRRNSEKFLGRPVLFPSDVLFQNRVLVPFLSEYAKPIAARLVEFGVYPVLIRSP